MAGSWTRLGIIAGAGALPVALASAAKAHGADGAPPFIIRLKGIADQRFDGSATADCALGEAGRLISLLKKNDCDAVVLAGLVARPDFSALKLDMRGAALLPKVLKAAARGDGALLDVLVSTLEREGFRVVGAHEIAGQLLAGAGALGRIMPDEAHLCDARKAAELVDAIGPFDVGQGAVVARGLVLAVEAAEGTDAMLARCAALPAALRGDAAARAGVLLKRPKPGQELRVDLPTIGKETVRGAALAGLAGIAFEQERALMMDADETIAEADATGLFLYGLSPDELA